MAQGHIILIKSDSKDIYNVTKRVSISNNRWVMYAFVCYFLAPSCGSLVVPTKTIDNCELFS